MPQIKPNNMATTARHAMNAFVPCYEVGDKLEEFLVINRFNELTEIHGELQRFV